MQRTIRLLVVAALGTAAVLALGPSDPASAGGSGTPQTTYFEHCGTTVWTVPSDVEAITFTVSGAAGGYGNGDAPGHAPGGLGGRSVGRLTVTPGEPLTIVVGCPGWNGDRQTDGIAGGSGYGNGGSVAPYTGIMHYGGGGGGGSAVRRGDTPLVVAGGGGGGGADDDTDGQPLTTVGGPGGGANAPGGDGGEEPALPECGGGGATTEAPGVGGHGPYDGDPGLGRNGGNGAVDTTHPYAGGYHTGGGGGGGFLGGGGGGATNNFPCGGGGGGSGYVDPGASEVSGENGVRAGGGQVVLDFESDVVAVPGNDEDEHATDLGGTSDIVPSVNTDDASAQSGEPAHAGETATHSVWYRLVAPFTGRARLDTFNSNFDTVVAVYTVDAAHEFTEVASNNDDPGGAGTGSPSVVTFPIQNGVTYLIAVDGADGDSGDVALGYQLVQPRPDARVRVGANGPLKGNNVYGTLTAQSVTSGAPRGGVATYRVSVQNDSGLPERLRLHGLPSARGFTVRYRTPSGANVTSQVVAGSFRTPAINPGGSYVLRAEVTVTRQAAPSLGRTVRATSTVDQGRTDTVRFTTRRR